VLGFITSTFGSLVADWSVDNMIPYQLSLDVGESQQTKKTKKNKQTNKKEKRNSRSRYNHIDNHYRRLCHSRRWQDVLDI
jgi:hypothetical protein